MGCRSTFVGGEQALAVFAGFARLDDLADQRPGEGVGGDLGQVALVALARVVGAIAPVECDTATGREPGPATEGDLGHRCRGDAPFPRRYLDRHGSSHRNHTAALG